MGRITRRLTSVDLDVRLLPCGVESFHEERLYVPKTLAGNFRLRANGRETGDIDFSGSAETFRAHATLENITGGTVDLTFNSREITNIALTGGPVSNYRGQFIFGVGTTGSFSFDINGQHSGTIDFHTVAAVLIERIQDALDEMEGIASGITVTGTNLNEINLAATGKAIHLTADFSGLTGTPAPRYREISTGSNGRDAARFVSQFNAQAPANFSIGASVIDADTVEFLSTNQWNYCLFADESNLQGHLDIEIFRGGSNGSDEQNLANNIDKALREAGDHELNACRHGARGDDFELSLESAHMEWYTVEVLNDGVTSDRKVRNRVVTQGAQWIHFTPVVKKFDFSLDVKDSEAAAINEFEDFPQPVSSNMSFNISAYRETDAEWQFPLGVEGLTALIHVYPSGAFPGHSVFGFECEINNVNDDFPFKDIVETKISGKRQGEMVLPFGTKVV